MQIRTSREMSMRSEYAILPTGPHVDVALGMLADFILEEAHRYEKVCPCRPLSMACDAMKSMLRWLGRWRSLPLLIALVVMLASYPYAGDGGALRVAAILIPITAIGTVATNRHHRVIAISLGLVTLAGIVQEISGAKVIPLLAVAGKRPLAVRLHDHLRAASSTAERARDRRHPVRRHRRIPDDWPDLIIGLCAGGTSPSG